MAINYDLINEGGISLSTNFELLSEKPLDSRLVVPSLEGLQYYIDIGAAYEGMIVYVSDEEKHYKIVKNGIGLGYEVFGGAEFDGSDYIEKNVPITIKDTTEETSTTITDKGIDISSTDGNSIIGVDGIHTSYGNQIGTFQSIGVHVSNRATNEFFEILDEDNEGRYTLSMSEDLIEQFKNILDVNQGQGLEDGTVLNGGTIEDWDDIK